MTRSQYDFNDHIPLRVYRDVQMQLSVVVKNRGMSMISPVAS